jgi:hypothetical protein
MGTLPRWHQEAIDGKNALLIFQIILLLPAFHNHPCEDEWNICQNGVALVDVHRSRLLDRGPEASRRCFLQELLHEPNSKTP